ncbi:Uncharacterised protein [BD1-7 clade bacterium]|uniref:TonB-dependent receptor-like beta-barrel domain-containing protein n=1 Tax=BD1-7 clade bacterium TaxID=2029982 RepID=A0A5S9R0W4_9GAMM|nr:Uncharacterised protein [BD1-7 clade bacterium]
MGYKAYADDDGMEYAFSGFATVQAAKTITGKNDGEVWDVPQDNWELSQFNKIGLRLDVDLKHNLDFAAQFVSYGRTDYSPMVDWLYVRYSFTPEINMSFGKTRIPLYMYSDVLDVGYAYQWIAPPPAVYGLDPLRANDGIQFNWVTSMGNNWYSDLTIWAGRAQQDIPELGDGASFTVDNSFGFAWDVEWEWLNLRAVYYGGKGSVKTPDLDLLNTAVNGLATTFGPAGIDLSEVQDRVSMEDRTIHFASVGANLDFGDYFFIGETTIVRTEDAPVYSDVNAFYLTAGYRLPANVTVSFTYSNNDDKADNKTFALYDEAIEPALGIIPNIPNLPAEQQAQLAQGVVGTGIGINALGKSGFKQENTYTLGARWDFHPMAATKFEYVIQDREKYNDLGTERFTVYPQAVRFSLDLVF